MEPIKHIKISGGSIYEIFSLSATTAESASTAVSALTVASAASVKGIGINGKGNLEISNREDSTVPDPYTGLEDDSKVNIVSKSKIQIKPGLTKKGKNADLALDAEYCTDNPSKFKVHVCNGLKDESDNSPFSGDTMELNLNIAELTIDTKDACTGTTNPSADTFDREEMHINFNQDKWNGGVATSEAGPIQAKLKARSFDLRCYDHGGIALQIAGQDGNEHENKLKFESDRIYSGTTWSAGTWSYCGEGGKGVEFGTFNTQKSSLYTDEYRFKGDAKVWGVTRNVPVLDEETGKIDYPTQSDDFKDVLTGTSAATWNEIIAVANAYKNGTIGGGSGSTSGDLSAYVTKVMFNEYTATTDSNINTLNTNVSAVKVEADAISGSAAVQHVSINDNGNLEASISAMTNEEEYQAYLVAKAYYDSLTEEERAASGITEPTLVEPDWANINFIAAGGRVVTKSPISYESNEVIFPFEISKTGKFTMGGVETKKGTINKDSKEDDLTKLVQSGIMLSIRVDKNNINTDETDEAYKNPELGNAYPEGSNYISVSLYDLLSLVGRVEELERRVEALENPEA